MTTKPITFSAPMVRAILDGRKTQTRQVMTPLAPPDFVMWVDPPVSPGAMLWVREACRAKELPGGCDVIHYLADGEELPIKNTQKDAGQWFRLYFRRGNISPEVPSPHMPRWASRLTLEVTDVRAERLRDITDEDAVASGIFSCDAIGNVLWTWAFNAPRCDTPREAFRALWEGTHGLEAWRENPWVWRYEFKAHRRNVDDMLTDKEADR